MTVGVRWSSTAQPVAGYHELIEQQRVAELLAAWEQRPPQERGLFLMELRGSEAAALCDAVSEKYAGAKHCGRWRKQ